MARPLRVFALADDLTGAAEIAGSGHRAGRTSAIVLGHGPASPPAEVTVADTDTRLRSPSEADGIVRTCADAFALREVATVFKKTDSVLRGHPRTEAETLAAMLGRSRILLVPANPGAGRTIRDGIYRVGGVPLAETEFRHDPHHPALTSAVRDLLGPGSQSLHVLRPGEPLPAAGLIVGEAETPADVAHWAGRVDSDTLPAGGGEFFAAILATRPTVGVLSATPFTPITPVLIVGGSTATSGREAVAWSRASGIPFAPLTDAVLRDPREPSWTGAIRAQLARSGVVHVALEHPLPRDPEVPGRIATALCHLARTLRDSGACAHLVVEGGATAAAVLSALGVGELLVVHEWAPGVVTLAARPGAPLAVTLKPGSYPWPDSLRRHFLSIIPCEPPGLPSPSFP